MDRCAAVSTNNGRTAGRGAATGRSKHVNDAAKGIRRSWIQVSPAALTRFLHTATYAFLTLPYLLFVPGWFRQPYAAVLVALLLVGTWLGIRQRASACRRSR